MLTLIFCIVSRPIAMGIFVMAVTSFLTVNRGGISPARYTKLMMVPLTFLLLSTAAIIINISKTPLEAFALPVGSYYITGELVFCTAGRSADCDGYGVGFLSVFSVVEHDDDRYSVGSAQASLPCTFNRTDAADLQIHICAA